MTKQEGAKGQTMIYKTLLRKLKIKEHEPHSNKRKISNIFSMDVCKQKIDIFKLMSGIMVRTPGDLPPLVYILYWVFSPLRHVCTFASQLE